MTSKDRHRQIRCPTCAKSLRSNNYKRHARTHTGILAEPEGKWGEELRDLRAAYKQQGKELQKLQEIIASQREDYPAELCKSIIQPTQSITKVLPIDVENDDAEQVEEKMLCANKEYLETIDLGKLINTILNKGVVLEESLYKPYKDALSLYRRQKPTRDMLEVELRPWQQELKTIIETPTEREIIWTLGTIGNEGKTWFQDYLAGLYGYARVVRLDLKLKTSNVLHVLSKRPLSSTDIFLFNERRAMNNEICNYTILESIKDGIAVSSKYNSNILQFKIPNVVVVFANRLPNTKELSKDRWKIFRIVSAGLKDITMDVWKMQHNK